MHAAYIGLPLSIETWVPFTNCISIESLRSNDAILIYPTTNGPRKCKILLFLSFPKATKYIIISM